MSVCGWLPWLPTAIDTQKQKEKFSVGNKRPQQERRKTRAGERKKRVVRCARRRDRESRESEWERESEQERARDRVARKEERERRIFLLNAQSIPLPHAELHGQLRLSASLRLRDATSLPPLSPCLPLPTPGTSLHPFLSFSVSSPSLSLSLSVALSLSVSCIPPFARQHVIALCFPEYFPNPDPDPSNTDRGGHLLYFPLFSLYSLLLFSSNPRRAVLNEGIHELVT